LGVDIEFNGLYHGSINLIERNFIMKSGYTFNHGKYLATVVSTSEHHGFKWVCAEYWYTDSVSGKKAKYPSYVHFRMDKFLEQHGAQA
jgi:hypothetical protein